MLKREPLDVPDQKEILATHILGGVPVNVYRSRALTLGQFASWPRPDIEKAYKEAANATEPSVDDLLMVQVIQGHVQVWWYEARGAQVPERVFTNQQSRIAEAKVAKKKRAPLRVDKEDGIVKVKDVIEAGLLAGSSTKEILEAVRERFPGSKASGKDVSYYRYRLKKAGKLPSAEKGNAE